MADCTSTPNLIAFNLPIPASYRARLVGHPLATGALQLPPHSGPLLPLDWPLFPIIMEYNRPVKRCVGRSGMEGTKQFVHTVYMHALTFSSPRDSSATESATDVVSMVTHSLHFILLLELLRPHVLRELPPGSRLARIMCTFLIGRPPFMADLPDW